VPELSIVIPVLGGLKRLEDTLVSVLENRPADCQVVVVTSEPYADPYDLKDEVCFVEAMPRAGLADVIRTGIRASQADIIHLLACGVEVSPGWTDIALARFDDPEVAVVAPLVMDRLDPQRIISAGLMYRPSGAIRRIGEGKPVDCLCPTFRAFCVADTLAAFYRRSSLEVVRGLWEGLGTVFAGVELALALKQAGFECVVEPGCRTYASQELASHSETRAGFEAERLFWRWAPVNGWLGALAGHAALATVELLQCPIRPATVCRLAGRVWGAVQLPAHRRHWHKLLEYAAPAQAPVNPPHFASADRRKPAASRKAG
jgi:hypothetical protein